MSKFLFSVSLFLISSYVFSQTLDGSKNLSLNVKIHLLDNSGWTHDELIELQENAVNAYKGCGIDVNFSINPVEDNLSKYQAFNFFNNYKPASDLAYLNKDEMALNVYFVKYVEVGMGPASGRALTEAPCDFSLSNDDSCFENLANTVWISKDPWVESNEYMGQRGVTVVTHEIAHILGLEHSYKANDIMDNGSPNWNPNKANSFFDKQCKILRENIEKNSFIK